MWFSTPMLHISLSHISVAPFVDVATLEIEVKGESTPLNVVLHPYATHVFTGG